MPLAVELFQASISAAQLPDYAGLWADTSVVSTF